MALIEWVDLIAAEPSAAEPEKKATKRASEKPAKPPK
jgi:hypothetical protein